MPEGKGQMERRRRSSLPPRQTPLLWLQQQLLLQLYLLHGRDGAWKESISWWLEKALPKNIGQNIASYPIPGQQHDSCSALEKCCMSGTERNRQIDTHTKTDRETSIKRERKKATERERNTDTERKTDRRIQTYRDTDKHVQAEKDTEEGVSKSFLKWLFVNVPYNCNSKILI